MWVFKNKNIKIDILLNKRDYTEIYLNYNYQISTLNLFLETSNVVLQIWKKNVIWIFLFYFSFIKSNFVDWWSVLRPTIIQIKTEK